MTVNENDKVGDNYQAAGEMFSACAPHPQVLVSDRTGTRRCIGCTCTLPCVVRVPQDKTTTHPTLQLSRNKKKHNYLTGCKWHT